MRKNKFIPNRCPHCGQSEEYILSVDPGTVDILKGFARFIKKKGINVAHVKKEVCDQGYITVNARGNIKRASAHGLLAKVEGEVGNYCITRKGMEFLKGMPVSRHAIISKVKKITVGYFNPEDTVTVNEYQDEYWQGVGFDILEGRVITKI